MDTGFSTRSTKKPVSYVTNVGFQGGKLCVWRMAGMRRVLLLAGLLSDYPLVMLLDADAKVHFPPFLGLPVNPVSGPHVSKCTLPLWCTNLSGPGFYTRPFFCLCNGPARSCPVLSHAHCRHSSDLPSYSKNMFQ